MLLPWKNLQTLLYLGLNTISGNNTRFDTYISNRPPINKRTYTSKASQYIEHKLTHIIIKSTFWFTNEKIDIDEGVFTTILEDYPMSKLMHKFIEKYRSKLAYSEVKMVN